MAIGAHRAQETGAHMQPVRNHILTNGTSFRRCQGSDHIKSTNLKGEVL